MEDKDTIAVVASEEAPAPGKPVTVEIVIAAEKKREQHPDVVELARLNALKFADPKGYVTTLSALSIAEYHALAEKKLAAGWTKVDAE